MAKKSIQVRLESGLEARLIALLVQEASKYESKIYLEANGKRVNAKSLIGMMSLNLDKGEELVVTAEGEDEETALEGIEKFLNGES
ncbi:MAG: HPr family phosphocarrier protein [Candidatus Gastranaerophilales bacterium]|nr:HPr family phosphocarrier protein [Candidatus Gastranaerophilales bacterium]